MIADVTPQSLREWARLHPGRLLVAPRVELTPSEVRVHGMVCAVCAARTRSALESATGVEDAQVDLEAGTVQLRLAPGTRLDGALETALQQAVEAVVIGMGARRWVAGLARVLAGRVSDGRR